MNQIKFSDDFEWQEIYPAAHAQQTQSLESDILFEVPQEAFINTGHCSNGKIVIPNTTKDIHINHRTIFETIYKLKPKSVFEVGFGYGNNLVSIHRLMPDIEICGCDISWKQAQVACSRYIECADFNLMIGDFLELDIPENSFDFVFSQAVIMHMSTYRAKKALKKMVSISKKYIMSTDGGLCIPDIRNFLESLGKVTYYDDIATKHWTDYFVPPFVIEKG